MSDPQPIWQKLLLAGGVPIVTLLVALNTWFSLEGRTEVRLLQDDVQDIEQLLRDDRARTQVQFDDIEQRLRSLEKEP